MARTFDVKSLTLAGEGRRRIAWAEERMPVLRKIREEFKKERPLRGVKMAACLHVTTETANLMMALRDGGADVALCASNPLSTQDDVAAALVKFEKIPTFAVRGEDTKRYYAHLRAVLDRRPQLTMDDGADLVTLLHTERAKQADELVASLEETTTGVIRLRALEQERKLRIPVIAVNDAATKHLFDNRYGTGQSTLDGVIRATNMLLAGRVVVVAGYGWCGRGVATRARGMGADVVVTEVDAIRALEAAMDGFRVMPMKEAAKIGDLFITLTGDMHVLRTEHFEVMKEGAILCNSGHFDIEIDLQGLTKLARRVDHGVRQHVDGYVMKSGRRIFVLGEGRLVNLAAAEGHPAEVMDMSFATQALGARWAIEHSRSGGLTVEVHEIPDDVVQRVATLKLASLGIRMDKLTPEQAKYLESWHHGT
ncbi:MAG: adenosylhomocysteinase [Candidatus Binatia bacterium]